jgi:hypothetical protein
MLPDRGVESLGDSCDMLYGNARVGIEDAQGCYRVCMDVCSHNDNDMDERVSA